MSEEEREGTHTLPGNALNETPKRTYEHIEADPKVKKNERLFK